MTIPKPFATPQGQSAPRTPQFHTATGATHFQLTPQMSPQTPQLGPGVAMPSTPVMGYQPVTPVPEPPFQRQEAAREDFVPVFLGATNPAEIVLPSNVESVAQWSHAVVQCGKPRGKVDNALIVAAGAWRLLTPCPQAVRAQASAGL